MKEFQRLLGEAPFCTNALGGTGGETLCPFAAMMQHVAGQKQQAFQDQFFSSFRVREEVKKAVDKNQFFLVYQPFWNTTKKQVVGAEALLRWQHPRCGLVMPDQFIPCAEEAPEVMANVDEWVIREACQQVNAWMPLMGGTWRQAVNLSAAQFEREGFAQRLMQIVEDAGVDPSHLELEITERGVLDDFDKAIKTLMELRHYGFSLSIDDFGTGFSSLAYLGRLPVQRVKIARELIRDITVDENAVVIVEGILSMAQGLKVNVLAEGVETTEQADMLKNMGCDEVQGYFLGKPMAPDDLASIYMK